MIFFWLAIIVMTIVFVYIVYSFYKGRKDPQLVFLWEWTNKHKKLLSVAYMSLLLIIIILLHKPLWATIGCQYEGSVRDSETKYDWMKKTCYYKTKNNTWLPLLMGRDTPENKGNEVHSELEQSESK